MTASKAFKQTVWISLAVGLLLGALALLHGTGTIVDTKQARAKQELLIIKTALIKFREERGRYPTEAEGLQALVDPSPQGKYFVNDRILHDPWGHLIVYQLSPKGDGFTIYSLGPDGIDKGGQGDNITLRS